VIKGTPTFSFTNDGVDVMSPLPNSNSRPSPLEDMTEIFELMSLKSHRPVQDCQTVHYRNNRVAYRVASWNLENLTIEKVSNLGVLEVLTRTILENG
jgi:hypothetical protein